MAKYVGYLPWSREYLDMLNKPKKKRFPPYPGSNMDYSVHHIASMELRKPNKAICIYCHEQALTEDKIVHDPECPTKEVP